MRSTELAQGRAIDILCDGARVHRSASHVAQTREAFFTLDVQMRGESVVKQAGREARLWRGDFVLTDSTRPYQVTFEKPVVMRLLRFPAPLLKRFVGCPEDLVGLRVDGSSGAGRIASLFLQSIWRPQDASVAYLGAAHMERAVLELLASAFLQVRSSSPRSSSLATLQRMQIVEAIEDRLDDSALTPSSLACAFRISVRYLHRLFSSDGETISRYILRRRLERGKEQLSDPSHDRRHVSEIAFSCGFSTFSHFCRAFRDQYGLSPGHYRRRRSISPVA